MGKLGNQSMEKLEMKYMMSWHLELFGDCIFGGIIIVEHGYVKLIINDDIACIPLSTIQIQEIKNFGFVYLEDMCCWCYDYEKLGFRDIHTLSFLPKL